MARDRSGPARKRSVPVADPILAECVFRVTARSPRSWGSVLARARDARGQSPAEQASDLAVSESALVFLSLCRLPDPGRRGADLAAVAALIGISTTVLERFLADSGAAA